MYVIYSEEETRINEDLGPAFWGNEDGWTTLDGATIYVKCPEYYIGTVMTYDKARSMVKLFELMEGTEVE